jgi:hypothetical protein
MIWPHRVILIVPASLLDTANKIGRALDPDTGGADTFSTPLPNATNPTHYGASTAAAESFVQTVQAVMSGQASLFDAVAADYALRWPGLAVPTVEECDAFLVQATIRVDVPWNDVLAELGLIPANEETA